MTWGLKQRGYLFLRQNLAQFITGLMACTHIAVCLEQDSNLHLIIHQGELNMIPYTANGMQVSECTWDCIPRAGLEPSFNYSSGGTEHDSLHRQWHASF